MKIAIVKGGSVIATSEQGCPGDPAHVFTVKVGEPQPACRQLIKVWGSNFTAKAAKIGIPHVIRHDHHDVGAIPGVYNGDRKEQQYGRKK
jgi:hypothetical protein